MSKKSKKELPEEENKIVDEVEVEEVNDEVQPAPQEASAEPGLAEELAAEKEKYLRLAAEYDNFRKRSQKERESVFTDVRADTILKLLPVYDNLSRALGQECSDEAFYKGVDMTMNQLKEIFTALGVSEIPAVGEPFNPELHNAVMHVEDENADPNTVVEEFEKGFTLGSKVIRFSMVKVAN